MDASVRAPDHRVRPIPDRPRSWRASFRTWLLVSATILLVVAGLWLGMALTRGATAAIHRPAIGSASAYPTVTIVASTPSASTLPLDNGSGYSNRELHESDYCECNSQK